MNEGGERFNVVVCSLDRDDDGFSQTFPRDSKWLSLPFGSKGVDAVRSKYPCPGVPTLVIVDREGKVIVDEGDREIGQGVQAFERWLTM